MLLKLKPLTTFDTLSHPLHGEVLEDGPAFSCEHSMLTLAG